MNPPVVADLVVNACGAIGLWVAIVTLHRRDPRDPSTRRVSLVLGLTALLFVLRAVAWIANSDLFDRASIACACLIPPGVLLATEASMRRHAPRLVKILVAGGAVALTVGVALGIDRLVSGYYVALPAFQVAVLATCAFLLVGAAGDEASNLQRQSVARIGWAIVIATPFVLSDFRSLFPDAPVRLGALGVLLAVTFWIADTGGTARQRAFILLALRVVAALVLGLAIAALGPAPGPDDLMRYSAVTSSGFLATGLLVDLVDDVIASRSPGILFSLADTNMTRREELVSALRVHPLFSAACRLSAVDLTDYDPEILSAALDDGAVWRLAEWPWGLSTSDPTAERVSAILATMQASHLVVIEACPLDILVMSVPPAAADGATETAIRLIGRMLANSVSVRGDGPRLTARTLTDGAGRPD